MLNCIINFKFDSDNNLCKVIISYKGQTVIISTDTEDKNKTNIELILTVINDKLENLKLTNKQNLNIDVILTTENNTWLKFLKKLDSNYKELDFDYPISTLELIYKVLDFKFIKISSMSSNSLNKIYTSILVNDLKDIVYIGLNPITGLIIRGYEKFTLNNIDSLMTINQIISGYGETEFLLPESLLLEIEELGMVALDITISNLIQSDLMDNFLKKLERISLLDKKSRFEISE